jgi:hypothetical protein
MFVKDLIRELIALDPNMKVVIEKDRFTVPLDHLKVMSVPDTFLHDMVPCEETGGNIQLVKLEA